MKPAGWNFLLWQHACDLLEQAERIQRNYLRVVISSHCQSSYSRPGTWVPPLNVLETGKTWWVMSALPGVEPDQIDVRLEGDQLSIAGTRLPPAYCREGELTLWEIPLGRFERRLNLTQGVSCTIDKIRFEDGLLIIELKKVL